MGWIFQSTLPARGATASVGRISGGLRISIHTPREGSDRCLLPGGFSCTNFNPHSPRGERRFQRFRTILQSLFQSTLPARGATVRLYHIIYKLYISIHTPREGSDFVFVFICNTCEYFNPHSPRGERRCHRVPVPVSTDISIHTPREGSDKVQANNLSVVLISIHTPREGSDPVIVRVPKPPQVYFNPHSPRGERRIIGHSDVQAKQISIHTPREGSDSSSSSICLRISISIHTPREGSDCSDYLSFLLTSISIHTPREGSDHQRRKARRPEHYFNPHSPRGERPLSGWAGGLLNRYFNPHSPRGERLSTCFFEGKASYFNPHSPRGERPGK